MRGHAAGPFAAPFPTVPGTFPNLRVQGVMILTPNGGQSQLALVDVSPTNPCLLKIVQSIDTALSTGTNQLTFGYAGSLTAYINNSSLGSPGIVSGETRVVITSPVTLIGALTSAGVAASLALTQTSTSSEDTHTVTIGGQVYTFNASLTNTANNVFIGASITAMMANLASAINAGAGSGTAYGAGTVANASVTATSAIGVLTVTAKVPGSAGNSIAVAETLSNGSWAGGATTLAGGANSAASGQVTLFIDA